MKYANKLNRLINLLQSFNYNNFTVLSGEENLRLQAIIKMLNELSKELEDV